jgi:hypothetical protein
LEGEGRASLDHSLFPDILLILEFNSYFIVALDVEVEKGEGNGLFVLLNQ